MKEINAAHGKAAGWSLGSLAGLALALKAAWVIYSKKYIDHHAKVNLTLEAERHTFSRTRSAKSSTTEVKLRTKKRPSFSFMASTSMLARTT